MSTIQQKHEKQLRKQKRAQEVKERKQVMERERSASAAAVTGSGFQGLEPISKKKDSVSYSIVGLKSVIEHLRHVVPSLIAPTLSIESSLSTVL
jgi:hypothetical protein